MLYGTIITRVEEFEKIKTETKTKFKWKIETTGERSVHETRKSNSKKELKITRTTMKLETSMKLMKSNTNDKNCCNMPTSNV